MALIVIFLPDKPGNNAKPRRRPPGAAAMYDLDADLITPELQPGEEIENIFIKPAAQALTAAAEPAVELALAAFLYANATSPHATQAKRIDHAIQTLDAIKNRLQSTRNAAGTPPAACRCLDDDPHDSRNPQDPEPAEAGADTRTHHQAATADVEGQSHIDEGHDGLLA